MTRIDFFNKLGRYLLLMLIAGIFITLGKKIVGGNECTACPEKSVCKGKSDCRKH